MASAIPLTFLLSVAWIIPFIFLLVAGVVLVLDYFVDVRGGVKFLFLREGSLMGVEGWLKEGQFALKRVQSVSITGDLREPVHGKFDSTFLKRGTFRVLILNGCGFRQWMSVSLARDA